MSNSGLRMRLPAHRSRQNSATPVYGYRVIKEFRHDSKAFTQGLVYDSGLLYESTGIRWLSSLREVELETGRVLRKYSVDHKYFAEGLALWQDRLIQLTWQSGIGFVYQKETFQKLSEFTYSGEGWGLTHNGSQLIMSDGTSELRFLDPETLTELSRVSVSDQGSPITRLNELEYIQGKVYANVWQTNRIAVIEPTSGLVEAWLDLTGLLPDEEAMPWSDVLNGIAYDEAGSRLFVTGKCWPKLYQIEVVEEESAAGGVR